MKKKNLYHFAEFGKICGGALHDLMSPLTSIILNIQELDSDTKLERNCQTKLYLDRALRSSRQLQGIMVGLYKQIRLQGELTYFSLETEIRQACDLLESKAEKIGCSLSFRAPKEILLWGNHIKFYQIMTNLIANAIDAYDGIPNTKKRVSISLISNKRIIIIKIRDWGVGLAPKQLPKIFKPFYTTKGSDKGIGLGLSLTKENIEKTFGGTIQIFSKLGKGSLFQITLPFAKNQPRT